MDPLARAKQVAFGYIQSQCLFTALRIGVADALEAGPRTAESMAQELGCNANTLGRLIETLTRLGLFTQDNEGRFAHNPASECLTSSHPNSLADLILFCGRESYQTFANLEGAVRNNAPVFEDAWGVTFWEHLQTQGDRAAIFGRAMERQSDALLSALVAQFDFTQFPHIADIGGGKGQLFKPLAAAGVEFQGTVLDQPSITALAEGYLKAEGLDMCSFVGGNFFEAVPSGADLYILKFVLHDWDDADCIRILNTLREEMKPGSKLMVIELFRGGDPSPWSFLSDMLMLTTFGAKERSDAQFRDILGRGGFNVTAVEQIAGAHYYAIAEVG